jgi:hypothetical protein
MGQEALELKLHISNLKRAYKILKLSFRRVPAMSLSTSQESPPPITLKLNEKFQACPVDEGEEVYPNGIFHFNISRLLAFLDDHPARFPTALIALTEIANYDESHLDEESVRSADLSRPILLAEISPGLFNVIDGNHRLAKARRDSMPTIRARRIFCPDHIPFLTSVTAYQKYVEYWNSKIQAMQPVTPRRRRARRCEIR